MIMCADTKNDERWYSYLSFGTACPFRRVLTDECMLEALLPERITNASTSAQESYK